MRSWRGIWKFRFLAIVSRFSEKEGWERPGDGSKSYAIALLA